MESDDIGQPIVIDNGSGLIKAGFAGDHVPKSVFPNYLGRPKNCGLQGSSNEEVNIGTFSKDSRKKISVEYPMEYGIVTNWDNMEKIWKYIYSKNQLATLSENHPVLLTESPLNPRPNREKYAEIFFELFNVPALFISMQAVLSLYSTGRVSGVVLESGDGVTDAVPIYQGFAMQHSVTRINVAGRDVTKYLRLLLRKERINFQTTAEFETVRHIKENLCYMATSSLDEEAVKSEVNYTLPDGNCIQVGPSRFRAPEVLFRPDLVGEECEGIHEMLKSSIQNSDLDLRNYFYKNIILSGGSTLFKGFGNRLLAKMKNICSKDVQIKIFAPKERLYSTWIGGSILGSLNSFKTMWVSKKEYEEDGRYHIFNKKHSDILLDQYYIFLKENNIV